MLKFFTISNIEDWGIGEFMFYLKHKESKIEFIIPLNSSELNIINLADVGINLRKYQKQNNIPDSKLKTIFNELSVDFKILKKQYS